MRRSREKGQLSVLIGLGSCSDDELSIITPCSVPYLSSVPSRDSNSDLLAKSFPSVRIYSEQDGTYATFRVKTTETTVADLKDFICSLRETRRAHHSSLDSQASTMDSDLNSHRERQESEVSTFGQDIQVYGYIPGQPRRSFSDSDTILKAVLEVDNLKLYYSTESFEDSKDPKNLKVTVYPKANLYELGINCFITISGSGLRFISEEVERLHNKIIFIGFEDISSITVYKQVENCLLLKRRTIGKSPFLVRAGSSVDFAALKKRLRQVSEVHRDSRLVSNADSRLMTCSLRLNNVESVSSLNALATFHECVGSHLGKKIFSEWIQSTGRGYGGLETVVLDGNPEVNLNNLVTFEYIKERLLSPECSSPGGEREFSDLLINFESYLKEARPCVEELLQVN